MIFQRHAEVEKEKSFPPVAIFLIIFAATLFLYYSPAPAANWHEGKNAFCGDCHDTHAEGGRMGLSKTANEGEFNCLRCHGNTQSKASNVFKAGKSAGYFEGYRRVSKNGHDLGLLSAKAGIRGFVNLKCTTCHDPHGNENFRNLRPNPLNQKESGVVIIAKGKSGSGKYEEVEYVKGISTWCQKCHTDLYSEQPDKRAHHKVGYRIKDLKLKIKLKKPLTVDLPMDDPLGDTKPGLPSSRKDDTMSCITCHYAHGSDNPYALRYADGKKLQSTCRSCHVGGLKKRTVTIKKRPKPPITKPEKYRNRAK